MVELTPEDEVKLFKERNAAARQTINKLIAEVAELRVTCEEQARALAAYRTKKPWYRRYF